MSQPTPPQMPHPTPHQLPHPGPQPVMQPHRQEMISSTETLVQPTETAPATTPYATNTLRSSSPKPDASELYLKSKALLDSKRKFTPAAAQDSGQRRFYFIVSIIMTLESIFLICFNLFSLQLLTPGTWMCILKGTRNPALVSESSEERVQISRWVFSSDDTSTVERWLEFY